MKANELRIGNVVNYEQTSHYVTQIRYNRIFSRWHKQSNMETDYECDIIELKPIPLTEEILLKCGFEKEDLGDDTPYEWFTNSIDSDIHIWDFNQTGEWIIDIGNSYERKEVYYLHQLQNLYFALTGEELTVNL